MTKNYRPWLLTNVSDEARLLVKKVAKKQKKTNGSIIEDIIFRELRHPKTYKQKRGFLHNFFKNGINAQ